VRAGFEYAFPVDALVRAFKYRGRWPLGRVLASLAAAENSEYILSFDLLVPVPLHWRRGVMRGFNPAREIALAMSRDTGIPMRDDCLSRTRATPAQSRANAHDRRRNVAGAFRAKPMEGRRVLVVDDVVTTGSTLEAVAHACRLAGAETVGGFAVAAADAPQGQAGAPLEERTPDGPISSTPRPSGTP